MASMVQMFSSNELRDQHMSNFEGYNSSASLYSSQFSFDTSSSAPPCNNNINDQKPSNIVGANAIWEEAKKICPQIEGPFTPPLPPLNPSAGTPHEPDHHHHHHHQDDHCSSYIEAITRNINADLLSFHHPHLPAPFDMDHFPLSDDNPLNELMGLHRKLNSSIYTNYGDDNDDDDLPQASMVAAADDQHVSLMHSYGDEVKLCNLARSFTFPPSHAAARSGSYSARSPLILASDAGEMNHGSNHSRQFNNMVSRDSSSAATTSCSHGDEDDHKAKDVRLKSEASEVSHCALGGRDEQGSTPQKVIPLRQSKKRSANMSNSSTSGKVARLDTPPDVVHVRARRGQATDSHSLAERVRREKISQRMKVLQEIVPGCHKVLGKAMMLDEIINYVKSLQKQVEFLSLKLAAANQAGMASMLTSEGNFMIPGVEFLGDLNSLCHLIKSEQLMPSSIQ